MRVKMSVKKNLIRTRQKIEMQNLVHEMFADDQTNPKLIDYLIVNFRKELDRLYE